MYIRPESDRGLALENLWTEPSVQRRGSTPSSTCTKSFAGGERVCSMDSPLAVQRRWVTVLQANKLPI